MNYTITIRFSLYFMQNTIILHQHVRFDRKKSSPSSTCLTIVRKLQRNPTVSSGVIAHNRLGLRKRLQQPLDLALVKILCLDFIKQRSKWFKTFEDFMEFLVNVNGLIYYTVPLPYCITVTPNVNCTMHGHAA